MGGGVDPPVAVVLSWPKANYINPETRGNAVVILEGVLLALCYIIVALRVYTRAIQARNFGIDDALIVFNLIPLTGLTACIIIGFTSYGWNRHIWDLTPAMLVNSRKTAMAIEMTYLISTCTTKISILLFYRRLGGAVSVRFRYMVYAAIGFVVSYCICYVILACFHCRPLDAYWNQANMYWRLAHPKNEDWTCTDEGAQVVSACVISMVQDFIACLLPMALFARLKISRKQKGALAGIFGVGLVLCICAVLRLIQTVHVYYRTYDFTWESYTVWIWTGVEAHMAVVCASLPAMNHFFRNVLQDTQFGSAMKSWTNKYSDGSSKSRSKGYGKSGSKSGDEDLFSSRDASKNQKGGIHVVREIKLEEFLDDKRYDLYHGSEEIEPRPWARGTNFIDQDSVTPMKEPNTWLEDDTSSGEDISTQSQAKGPSRQYSGFADTRRFY